MTLATKILDRKSEIQRLIASNNLEKALKRLMDFCTDFSRSPEDRKAVLELNKAFRNQAQQPTDIAAQSLLLLDQVCTPLFR
ncbi:MAG: hypothetical protein AAF598_17875 [Bacteroidota bacterium]